MMRSGSRSVEHMHEQHNDEHMTDRAPERFGSYPYDRQDTRRSDEETLYKPRALRDDEYGRGVTDMYRMDERALYRSSAVGDGMYAGAEPRRRQEMYDAGMIHEDHRAIANLPQQVMIKPYPMTGPYLPEGLDDTIRGIDHQMDYDDSQRAKHFFPKKV